MVWMSAPFFINFQSELLRLLFQKKHSHKKGDLDMALKTPEQYEESLRK
jgi:hypothetical protein